VRKTDRQSGITTASCHAVITPDSNGRFPLDCFAAVVLHRRLAADVVHARLLPAIDRCLYADGVVTRKNPRVHLRLEHEQRIVGSAEQSSIARRQVLRMNDQRPDAGASDDVRIISVQEIDSVERRLIDAADGTKNKLTHLNRLNPGGRKRLRSIFTVGHGNTSKVKQPYLASVANPSLQ
jgi:hypothetical protein